MPQLRYTTPHGITVTRLSSKVAYERGLGHVLKQLDTKRGVYFSSGYEYPERYSRWDVASVAPPLEIVGRGRAGEVISVGRRGTVLVDLLEPLLQDRPRSEALGRTPGSLSIQLKPLAERFPE